MESLRIVFLGLAAAIAYGIAQDQITARVCVEYFSIGHPPVFRTKDPTLLAFGWGVLATWWVGLPLGILLAIAARAGRRPRRSFSSLLRPVCILCLVTACGAAIAGIIGWQLARHGYVQLDRDMATYVPVSKHDALLSDLWAHSAAYLVSVVGALVVLIHVWRSRRQPHSRKS